MYRARLASIREHARSWETAGMDEKRVSQLNWISSFIWGIADGVLRDLYVRGKYRDVILPMTVLRRLDAVLEPTKQAVLDLKVSLDKADVVHQDQALRRAAEKALDNNSKFTLRDTRARASQQHMQTDIDDYLCR